MKGRILSDIYLLLPSSQIKSLTLTFSLFKILTINGKEQNLFTIVRYGTLIVSQKRMGLSLRRLEKEKWDC